MIDSHTHLDLCDGSAAELVKQAQLAGVTRLLTVGTTPAGSKQALAFAADFPGVVFAAVGCHPNEAQHWSKAAQTELYELAQQPGCVAIGETGLDYYREYATPEAQREAFHAQIQLAKTVQKPLIIHCRAAEEELLSILEQEAQTIDVVLHCFSMPEQLDRCLTQTRWWFSFAGNVTYRANTALAQAADRIPLGRILVETDAPYLPPQPFRGKRNCPAYVVETARYLAARRKVDVQRFADQVTRNAQQLFGW